MQDRTRIVKSIASLIAIVAAGILSRAFHTGLILFDKYLGDALYAAMVYTIWRFFAPRRQATAGALIAMTVIEFFQLTMIPAQMLASDHLATRLCARLLGTQFSALDLLAYAVGIVCIHFADAPSGPTSLAGS